MLCSVTVRFRSPSWKDKVFNCDLRFAFNFFDDGPSKKYSLLGLATQFVGQAIDNRVGDWQQSRDPFRTRGPSEVVVFTPQNVSQGVDFLESITERFMMLCEGNC